MNFSNTASRAEHMVDFTFCTLTYNKINMDGRIFSVP